MRRILNTITDIARVFVTRTSVTRKSVTRKSVTRKCVIRKRVFGAVLVFASFPAALLAAEPGTYQTTDAFVTEVFGDETPPARALWMRAELRDEVAAVLGRQPAPRIRYWQKDGRTVWVLDAVGKDQPITAGVVVDDGAIGDIRVLAFRESRGWEIRYPFFTDQFHDALLTPERKLDRQIDGITGATLSVRAMTNMARVALLLDAHTRHSTTTLAAAR